MESLEAIFAIYSLNILILFYFIFNYNRECHILLSTLEVTCSLNGKFWMCFYLPTSNPGISLPEVFLWPQVQVWPGIRADQSVGEFTSLQQCSVYEGGRWWINNQGLSFFVGPSYGVFQNLSKGSSRLEPWMIISGEHIVIIHLHWHFDVLSHFSIFSPCFLGSPPK